MTTELVSEAAADVAWEEEPVIVTVDLGMVIVVRYEQVQVL